MKDTTDKESLKNIAISSLSAGLASGLSVGVSEGFGLNSVNDSSLGLSSSFSQRIADNLKVSFQDVAINGVSSSAVQSLIKGDSFSETLEGQLENAVVMTLAKVGANEIGRLSHETVIVDKNGDVLDILDPKISQPTQLALHGVLGGVTAKLSGADVAVGAVSGVAEEVKKAVDELKRIKRLRDEGKASDNAVRNAEENLALANANLALANIKLAASASKSAANFTSLYTGFYADLKMKYDESKTVSNSLLTTNIGSNIFAQNDINLNSGSEISKKTAQENNKGNINQVGSLVVSKQGDINYDAKNNINIEASIDEFNQSSKQKSNSYSVTLASTNIGGQLLDLALSGLGLSAGYNKSSSTVYSKTYNNSNLSALNGKVNLNSGSDLNIISSNLEAKDVELNVGGNLNLISKQNEFYANSKSRGFGIGINGGEGGLGGSISANSFYSNQDRKWVDNQASVIATDSVVINVGSKDDNNFYQNDTGKINIEGGLIANIVNYSKNVDNEDVVNNINNVNKNKLSWLDGGNLLINAKEITYSDINDFNFSESSGYDVSLSTKDFSDLQRSSFYPEGSFGLSLVDRANEKEQKTRATIGLGQVNLADNDDLENNSNNIKELNRNIKLAQNITKDEITSALDAHIEVDLRLLSENGRSDIAGEVVNLGGNLSASTQGLLKSAELLSDQVKLFPILGDTIFYNLSPIEQLAHFSSEPDSAIYIKNLETGEIISVDSASLTKNYAVNGISTPLGVAKINYLKPEENKELTLRHNPSHGFVGDLLESGVGKIANFFYIPEIVAINNLVANDYWERRDIEGATNLHHSQATIIGIGAMQIYNKKWVDVNGEFGDNQINVTQRFVAVAPAVTGSQWKDALEDSLGVAYKRESYNHDDKDPVYYLTNPIDFDKPAIGIDNVVLGIYHGLTGGIKYHDVKNQRYIRFLHENDEAVQNNN